MSKGNKQSFVSIPATFSTEALAVLFADFAQ
jgi:hypothetical protein